MAPRLTVAPNSNLMKLWPTCGILLATIFLGGCDRYEAYRTRQPNPMSGSEYDRIVDERTNRLMQQGYNPYAAKSIAEDEADSKRFERSIIPQDGAEVSGSWKLF